MSAYNRSSREDNNVTSTRHKRYWDSFEDKGRHSESRRGRYKSSSSSRSKSRSQSPNPQYTRADSSANYKNKSPPFGAGASDNTHYAENYEWGDSPPSSFSKNGQSQQAFSKSYEMSSLYPPPAPRFKDTDNLSPPLKEEKSKSKKSSKKSSKKRSKSSSSSSSSSSSNDDRKKKRSKKKNKKASSESSSSSDSSSEEERHSKTVASDSHSTSSGLNAQQREVLEKQQQSYKVKLEVLQKEIVRLMQKEKQLIDSRADIKLIDENLKLQTELKSRVNAVDVVLHKINDVLRGGSITSDGKPRPAPPPPPKISTAPNPPISQQKTNQPQHPTTQVTKTSAEAEQGVEIVLNHIFYDDGIHWCRFCNVFPPTLNELLLHLHTEKHHIQIEQLGIEEEPWHSKKVSKKLSTTEPSKKVPFKGMQFFTPVKGWFCKLCSQWMGDLHCAEEHLKTQAHERNFAAFTNENPEWESKFSTDREKARTRAGLGPDPKNEFETKLKSENDGNDDENTKSFIVQMRKKDKEAEEARTTLHALEGIQNRSGPVKEEQVVDEWMSRGQKVTLDFDAQKIVSMRQKVLAKESEKKEEVKKIPPEAPKISKTLTPDRNESKDSQGGWKRNEKKIDLKMDFRRRERSRSRERRRTRSRSRSRSSSRGRYERYRSSRRRSSRDRSRSRDRERSKEFQKKSLARKLPIIGKMPLFGKRKDLSVGSKGKEESSTSYDLVGEYGPVQIESIPQFKTAPVESYAPTPVEEPQQISISTPVSNVSVKSSYDYSYSYPTTYTAPSSYGASQTNALSYNSTTKEDYSPDTKPPGETEDFVGTTKKGLPNDLQHALDLIYHAGGPKAPQVLTFPPKNIEEHTRPAASYKKDYGDGGYRDYQPYQHSFEGYGPADFPEAETVPTSSSLPYHQQQPFNSVKRVSMYDEIKGGGGDNDDMEDLRMLGIDVDDTAAVNYK